MTRAVQRDRKLQSDPLGRSGFSVNSDCPQIRLEFDLKSSEDFSNMKALMTSDWPLLLTLIGGSLFATGTLVTEPVQPQPANRQAATADSLQSRRHVAGQAFAQVKDDTGVLNSDALKARKKKRLNAR
jgi:hypothetical protein